MQVPPLVDQPGWLTALRSPAATLTAFAVAGRLVLIPAVTTLLRRDLKPELSQLADHERRIPAVERDVKELRHDVDRFAGMSEQLARIEEQLRTLLKDRSHPPHSHRTAAT